MTSLTATVSRLARRKKMRLGDLLLDAGAITQDQLDEALALQKRTGHKLGRSLTEVGAIDEAELYRFLAKRLEIDYLDLGSIKLQAEIVKLLPEVQARRLRALVLKPDKDALLVGMADPTDIFAHDELSRLLGKPVTIALVNESELLRTIDIMYRRTDEINALAEEVKEELGEGRIDLDQLTADEDSAEAPVIKLLQSMFRDAVQVNASDIHIEPDEFVLRIRQRVDGMLQEHVIDGRGVATALVTRLKLMSGLDISEKRLPQDGRFSIRVNDTTLDIRVSTLPVQFGEAIVLRLLDQSANLLGLDKLGMPPNLLERFLHMIGRPSGMVLVTGPTGSGKTTTLYSALNHVNKPSTKIVTVEDPVEYRLERINQVQVHPRIGLDFGRVLRTALRQDPDIILVGEMRDRETVDIGLRAAMTGHLVFSTLHTVSAVATASRLFDMGAPGYLIGAALQGIVAQRLVRRVCDSCAEPVELSPGQSAWLKAQIGSKVAAKASFVQGRGCNYCQLTGFRGRIGVYELLEMDSGLTDALRREDLSDFVALAAKKKSYVPLVNCALDYAISGVTTLDEVLRVAGGLDSAPEPDVDNSADVGEVANV
ncbi:MAG: GspE/PulE family protein [Gammaproteobacteria bacterium]|nr:GspE/PulE family protein [Gammaproteobacteria bacterium]MBU2675792.1 GspE/PulE family protein [Gammaproteobacteria bacterium]NNL49529.1 Flp pilus assembly complex ATPase component TadA [Woeseiaceae bacterium]